MTWISFWIVVESSEDKGGTFTPRISSVIVIENTPSESASILETGYCSLSGWMNFLIFKLSGYGFYQY